MTSLDLTRPGGASVTSRQPSGGFHRGGRVSGRGEIAVEVVHDPAPVLAIRMIHEQLAQVPLDGRQFNAEELARIALARKTAAVEILRQEAEYARNVERWLDEAIDGEEGLE